MVLVQLWCFPNLSLRKYVVFFSPSSIHLALDRTCAPCACFISWSSRSRFSWSVFHCSSPFWGSVARFCCALIRLVLAVVSTFDIPYFQKELEFCFKHFLCCFRIVSLILKCASIKLFVSAIKSAYDSNEELNFQYPWTLLKLFILLLTLTSLWSECEKPSMLVFVILAVRDVGSQKL